MNTEMKLNQLFGDKRFLEENKDRTALDAIYEAVVERIPEVEKEELDAYLKKVSEAMCAMDKEELEEEDLTLVAGGAVLETLAAAAAIITFCYGAGCAIGKAIKKWKNG